MINGQLEPFSQSESLTINNKHIYVYMDKYK